MSRSSARPPLPTRALPTRPPTRPRTRRGTTGALFRLVTVVTAVVLSATALGAQPAAAGAPTRTRAATTTAEVSGWAAQTIQGFGASGAWWPKQLARFSPARQQDLADLLFSDKGIQLSAYRYNLGGGGVGVTRPDRAPETPRTGSGTYDWSRDPGGTTFLTAAARAGVPTLVGFVNSAPADMTTNGKTCGGALTPGAEQQFADHIADIVAHFRSQGVQLTHLSPMNEPDDSFSHCTQEGMTVPVGQRAKVINTLADTLAERGLPVGITADESSNSGQVLSQWPTWMGEPGTAANVTALAHHTYDYPSESTLTDVQSMARRLGKPSWASEICCFTSSTGGWGQQYDPAITGGLTMAGLIHRDLTVTGDTQFHWWTALSGEIGCKPTADPACPGSVNSVGWNDGLIYYDPDFAENGNQSLYVTKRYYVLGQFSKFVRPGAVRFPVTGAPSGVQVLATSGGGQWTLVVTNTGTSAQSFDVHFNALNGIRPAAAYRTSATENLAKVALASVSGETAVLSVPAQSVSTYTFTQYGGAAPKTGASSLVGAQSGKCAADPAAAPADGDQVVLWTCDGGQGQQWTYTADSELRAYGRCLDASGGGTGNGTPLILYTCGGGLNQKWTLVASGEIRGVQSGRCVDATGQGTADGTRLTLYTCNAGTNQKWSRPN